MNNIVIKAENILRTFKNNLNDVFILYNRSSERILTGHATNRFGQSDRQFDHNPAQRVLNFSNSPRSPLPNSSLRRFDESILTV